MTELKFIYDILFKHFGKQYWWPAETSEEIIIGAILTQNTNWSNVIKALENLKRYNLCSLESLSSETAENLALLIKPAGYFNVKAQRLIDVSSILKDWQPSRSNLKDSRDFLLSIKGIGQETADSILLYAFNMPVFVIDAYTIRLMERLNAVPDSKNYSYYQDLFMEKLPLDACFFNEYHALIVQHCKMYCKRRPICMPCPLSKYCNFVKY